jgi:AraC-like DNA-binding protein
MQFVFALRAGEKPSTVAVGARSEFLTLPTSVPLTAVGVQFKPGGAFPFVHIPGGELHNRHVPLDDLWGATAIDLAERLYDTSVTERRFRILESAMVNAARGRFGGHRAVRYAVCRLENGGTHVSEVARQIGMSHRHFSDLFRNEVGLSPKVFCRVRRFNEVLKRLDHATRPDWVQIALSCGYFDQSHFNHDFHAFSGINPSAYLQHRTSRTHVAIK